MKDRDGSCVLSSSPRAPRPPLPHSATRHACHHHAHDHSRPRICATSPRASLVKSHDGEPSSSDSVREGSPREYLRQPFDSGVFAPSLSPTSVTTSPTPISDTSSLDRWPPRFSVKENDNDSRHHGMAWTKSMPQQEWPAESSPTSFRTPGAGASIQTSGSGSWLQHLEPGSTGSGSSLESVSRWVDPFSGVYNVSALQQAHFEGEGCRGGRSVKQKHQDALSIESAVARLGGSRDLELESPWDASGREWAGMVEMQSVE
ncbi:hypothetical protein CLOM_g14126 [Closterium sp. NIES-68]|nr:hypothetical protein CLOM_g14126 [Closterium sp. NIES-68]